MATTVYRPFTEETRKANKHAMFSETWLAKRRIVSYRLFKGGSNYFFFFFFLSSPEDFLKNVSWREKGRERERNTDVRERHQWVASHKRPDWKSNSQPRYVP